MKKQHRDLLPFPTSLPAGLFVCFVLFLSATPALAQANRVQPGYKNPGKATLISVLVPGGGHLYAGERTKGFLLLAGSSAALIGGAVLSDWESNYDFTCSNSCIGKNEYDPNYTPMLVGAGVAGALWLYSLLDAPRAARRTNRRHGVMASVSVTPTPVLRSGALEPGFSMRLTF